MTDADRGASRRSGADSVAAAIPVELLAEHVDADVVSALGRWRNVDPHSLHALASTLWTKGGEFISDSPGYLRALHGFVSEKIAFDHLSQAHRIDWPEQTNVPALDMTIDGDPTQIKEGTTAYQQVQHALHRYPDITSFVTDPATAHKLQEHGVDAMGVAGLDPGEIANSTRESAVGLEALEQAGQLHLPVLTTLFSICKYWERYDAEQIDGATAVRFFSTDITAQSVGAAAGLKLASIYIVATGGFGLAALPLTAGAIVGAMGLRHVIGLARGRRLRDAIQVLEDTRSASEMATEIITERSRGFAASCVELAWSKLREANADAAAEWVRDRNAAFSGLSEKADPICRNVIARLKTDHAGEIHITGLANAFAESDPERRCVALDRALTAVLRQATCLSSTELAEVAQWIRHARREVVELEERRGILEAAVSATLATVERETRLNLVSEYALLLERLTKVAAPVASALARVEIEGQRLGAK